MAVINKLRKRGWLLLVVVGATLLLFILQAVIENTNKIGFSGKESIGEIDGKKIKIAEYDAEYRNTIAMQEANGAVLNEEQKENLGNTVWNKFIVDNLLMKEFEKIGIAVSDDEAFSLLYTNDASPVIKQNFTQEGQQFDPANVINFRNQISKKGANMTKELYNAKQQYEIIVDQVIIESQNKKYNSLIAKSLYTTALDAQQGFANNAYNVSGKIITLNYTNLPDKDFKVTDSDLKDYISKHKEEFKQEENRDIEFALWTIAPSAQDTLAVKNEVAKQINDFAKTENDSEYVTLYSTAQFDTTFRRYGNIPKILDEAVYNAPKDSVVGPIFYNGGFSLIKVLATKFDSINYCHLVKAEIVVKGTTKQDTLAAIGIGKGIIAESKNVALNKTEEFFSQKASQGILQSPMDMDWMQESNLPPDVKKSIKGLTKGQAVVVKSVFGLSIYKMVDNRSNKLVKFAEVRKNIEPLSATIEAVKSKASEFRNGLTGKSKTEFEDALKKANLSKSLASNIKPTDKTINGISNSKEIIRWLYNDDRKEGEVSDVFSFDDRQVVVKLAKIKKEGTASVEDVREKVEKLVINEKKAEKLKADLEKVLKTAKTIEDVAVAVKSIAQPIDKLSLAMPSVPFAGNDSKMVGFVMGSKLKTLSKPYASSDGVHVIYLDSETKTEMPKEMLTNRMMMNGEQKSRVSETSFAALKKAAKIKDERYKFY